MMIFCYPFILNVTNKTLKANMKCYFCKGDLKKKVLRQLRYHPFLSSPLKAFYNEVKKKMKIKPLSQPERNRRHEEQTSCAVTWYHELSLQLAVGLIILNNSKHASEKATCPEEGAD